MSIYVLVILRNLTKFMYVTCFWCISRIESQHDGTGHAYDLARLRSHTPPISHAGVVVVVMVGGGGGSRV